MSQELITEVQRLFDELVALPSPIRASRIQELAITPVILAELTSLLTAADRVGDFLGVLSTPVTASRPLPQVGILVAKRYRIKRELGSGATGVVFQAYDQQLDRDVALKFLQTPDTATSTIPRRFLTEARAAARLDHANVATVHDIVELPDGELFIAMAYCSGENLRDRIARGPLQQPDALAVAAQIASALGAAHAAGIVHRDVKPANVIFDVDGSVKLTDFGVAKLASDYETTDSGVAVGTLAYMSPEQVRGELVDDRSDLWSLGVVLYEMLTGNRPFAGDNIAALLNAILNSNPTTPTHNHRNAPLLNELIAALLSKDADNRPHSAIQVSHMISQIVAGVGEDSISLVRPAGGSELPNEITSFIGREREMEIARGLLSTNRLLTLTGPGGTGKTRLAMHLARAVQKDLRDAVWVVFLAEVTDPDLVATMIAQVLGLRDLGGGQLSSRVGAALRDRRTLLLLDNFEHVLGAASFVSELLLTCPELTILITSRTPLTIGGEQEFPVPPLGTPAIRDSAADESEAVQLFVQRARAVRPDFSLNDETIESVAEICRRLDGLPLALELAAARAKLLSPRAMLSRLEHRLDLLRGESSARPSRHGTMRDVIDWSYVLLTEPERALFDVLAVFAGGISVEAAEAVSALEHGDPPATFAVLDTLGSLCNKSLLRHDDGTDGEPRFAMLETVREFGLDRLRSTSREATARRTHATYYVSLAERGAAQLRGPTQAAWFDRFDVEYANFRIALDCMVADAASKHGTALTDATRLALALHRFWFTRGPLLEGVEYLRRLIELADAADRDPAADHIDPKLHAKLLTGAAHLANTRSIFREARDLFERSLELQRRVDDLPGVATTLNNLGWTEWIIGDLSRGEELSNTAMGMHEARGDALGISLSLNNLAWIAMERGEYERAEEHFATVIESHRKRGDLRTVAFAMGWVGVLATRRRDYPRAIALHQAAIEMLEPVAERAYRSLSFVRLAVAKHAAGMAGSHARTVEEEYLPPLWDEGRLWPIAFALTELGTMLRDEGALEAARTRLLEALDVRANTGALHGVAEARQLLGSVYTRQLDSARAADSLSQALREATAFGATPTVLDCIESIATLLVETGNPESAAILIGAVDARRCELSVFRAIRYQAEDQELRFRIKAQLDRRAVLQPTGDGTARSIDDARFVALNALLHI